LECWKEVITDCNGRTYVSKLLLYNNADKCIFIWRKLSTSYNCKSIGLLSMLPHPTLGPMVLINENRRKNNDEEFEVDWYTPLKDGNLKTTWFSTYFFFVY